MADIDFTREPMRPEVVLLAGGRTKDAHMGNERLLTLINGVPLIVRTIQQFNKWAFVTVVTNDPRIKKAVAGQKHIRITWEFDDASYGQIDMIRKGLKLAWARRSIIVFGDVVFTDKAVEFIRDNDQGDEHFTVFGRSGASKIVGTPYAEYFAIEVNWLGREHGKHAADEVRKFWHTGEWHQATAWEWYRHMEKIPYHIPDVSKIDVGPHWVEIDDGTDDIDFIEDANKLQEVHSGR